MDVIYMGDVNVSIIIPLLMPFPREGIDGLVAGTHRQLVGLSNKIYLNRPEQIPMQFRWLPQSDVKKVKTEFFKFRHIRTFKLLEAAFHVPYRESQYQVGHDGESHPDFVADLAMDAALFLRTLSLATNIARPGSFEFDRPMMFVEGEKPFKLDAMLNSLDSIFSFGNKIQWPKIETLRLIKVWNWLKEIDDVWIAFGTSPSGRALAAFSHLFTENWGHTSPLDDLWSIVGLEAIYNSNGRQRELIEKACLFLGDANKAKKLIETVYGTRSGLIHGGMDFPFSYCDFDGLPDYEAWSKKGMALQDQSILILIATLQRMAKEGIYSIEFERRLKKQHIAPSAKSRQK